MTLASIGRRCGLCHMPRRFISWSAHPNDGFGPSPTKGYFKDGKGSIRRVDFYLINDGLTKNFEQVKLTAENISRVDELFSKYCGFYSNAERSLVTSLFDHNNALFNRFQISRVKTPNIIFGASLRGEAQANEEVFCHSFAFPKVVSDVNQFVRVRFRFGFAEEENGILPASKIKPPNAILAAFYNARSLYSLTMDSSALGISKTYMRIELEPAKTKTD